jgi:hypothetical protein
MLLHNNPEIKFLKPVLRHNCTRIQRENLECEGGIFDFTFSPVSVVERTKAIDAVVTCRCGNCYLCAETTVMYFIIRGQFNTYTHRTR